MATYLRSGEAARRLGVTLNTLYAYVSRGRVQRTLAADGRTSLFDLDEIDALRAQSRRGPSGPPPSIDVRIATGVTHLDETGPSYRGRRVETLLDRSFEDVAELLWSGDLPSGSTVWAADRPASGVGRVEPPGIDDLIGVALELDDGAADGAEVGRRLLANIPAAFGVPSTHGDSVASSVTRLWVEDPSTELVTAIDRALLLLADHELATSTLAVRVATSVRSSTTMCLVAGLAAVAGDLHGGAPRQAHRLLATAAEHGAHDAIARMRAGTNRVPGFGHSIYRLQDPRFAMLLERVRELPDPHGRMLVVDQVLAEAGASVPRAPNIDLAVAALTFVADLPDDAPIFAIARIAGWTAHHLEERDERPLRFRGLAR